jgi:hypothetical protein
VPISTFDSEYIQNIAFGSFFIDGNINHFTVIDIRFFVGIYIECPHHAYGVIGRDIA